MTERNIIRNAKQSGGIPRHWPVESISPSCDGQLAVVFQNPQYDRRGGEFTRCGFVDVNTRTYNRYA